MRSRLAEEVVVKAQLQQEIAELQEFRGVYLELKREMQRRENAYQACRPVLRWLRNIAYGVPFSHWITWELESTVKF